MYSEVCIFKPPPHDHEKIVYCIAGEVIDYIVDLRYGSPFYGKYEEVRLDEDKANILYLPKGIAHGFYVLSNHAIMCYKVTSVYNKEYDTGILWNSVISLNNDSIIISDRDLSFRPIEEFVSPFVYKG